MLTLDNQIDLIKYKGTRILIMNWNKQVMNRKTAIEFTFQVSKIVLWPDQKCQELADLAFDLCEDLVSHDGRTEEARELTRKIRDIQVHLTTHIDALPDSEKKFTTSKIKRCGCGCSKLSEKGDFLPGHESLLKNKLMEMHEQGFTPRNRIEKLLWDGGKFSYKPISLR